MAEALECSRAYLRIWKTQIRKRLRAQLAFENTTAVIQEEERLVGEKLARRLEEIDRQRDQARDGLTAALAACSASNDLVLCRQQARAAHQAEMDRLAREETQEREEARTKRDALRVQRAAATRTRTRILEEVQQALGAAAVELAGCAETACGVTGVSGAPALGCPSEILPAIAFAGPRQPKAARFYRQWNVPTSEVTSLQGVVEAVAALPQPVRRLRLTCHANQEGGMELAAFNPAAAQVKPPAFIDATELDRLTEGDRAYFARLLFTDVVDTTLVSGVIAKLDPSAPYFAALNLDQPRDLVAELISWLVFANLPGARLRFRPRPFGITPAFSPAARLAADDLTRTLAASLDPAALNELARAVRELVTDDQEIRYTFENNTADISKKTRSAVAALHGGFRGALQVARQKLTPDTVVDLRGCWLTLMGSGFLTAMARFLMIDPGRVTGPKWLTTIGTSARPAVDVSLDCLEDLRRAARKDIVTVGRRRWLEELSIEQTPGTEFEMLLRYFRDIAPVLPVFQAKGTELQNRSTGDVVVSRGFRCAPDPVDLRNSMRSWLRSLWLDAPDVTVDALADEWIAGRPPYFEALVEKVRGVTLDTQNVVFPMSPSYAQRIAHG